jgi:hypothetical protein
MRGKDEWLVDVRRQIEPGLEMVMSNTDGKAIAVTVSPVGGEQVQVAVETRSSAVDVESGVTTATSSQLVNHSARERKVMLLQLIQFGEQNVSENRQFVVDKLLQTVRLE